jgi:hypothetical protein
MAALAEVLLRVVVLASCLLGFGVLARVAWWTVEPLTRYIYESGAGTAVAVEPIGFIESGKLQTIQGAPAARSLSHRLQRVTAALRRDFTEEYAIVQSQLNVSLPEASAPAGATFDPVVSEPVAFEAKLFNVDVVGIGNFFYRQLYRGDTVRVLVEVLDSNVRYFVEVTRPGKPTGERSRYVDRTVAGDLHQALERVACDIAFIYHGGSPRFSGMSPEVFCDFLGALGGFQSFVTETAAAARGGAQFAPALLNDVIEAFESRPLAQSGAPIVHTLRASL